MGAKLRLTILLATLSPLLTNCGGFEALQNRLGARTGNYAANFPQLTSSYGQPPAEMSQAWNDLSSNFWQSGHIKDTTDGYPMSSGIGSMWERSQFMFVLLDYAALTNDVGLKGMVQSEWTYTQQNFASHFSSSVFTDCTQIMVNANDDAGWAALYYVGVYKALGDQQALSYAKGMVTCSYSYFNSGNGILMYQKSAPNYASSYEVGLMTAAYEIYQITGDQNFRNLAMQSYNWMQSGLLRDDGLYYNTWDIANSVAVWFMDHSSAWMHESDMLPGQSDSFLAANMAMAVMNARLYKETGDDSYRQLAISTMKGIVNVAADSNGVLIDDRDGWVNGTFATRFAQEAVTLPGAPPRIKTTLFNTAASVMGKDRSWDGYYGADWDGSTSWSDAAIANATTDGGMCAPKQIMSSASAVMMVLAASTLTVQHPVIGNFEGASGDDLTGWACASGWTPSVSVDVYLGNDVNSASYVTTITANQSSEAQIASACGTSGSAYRFNFTLDSDTVNAHLGQSIFLYGISPVQGENVLLPGSGNFQVVTLPVSSTTASSGSTATGSTSSTSSSGGQLAASPASSGPLDTSGQTLVNGATYTIKNVASGKCLDITDGRSGNGVRVQQYACGAGDVNQQWTVQANADGSYSFIANVSSKVLDFDANTLPANGSIVQQWQVNGGGNQSFVVDESPAGGYQIAALSAQEECLDIPAVAINQDGVKLETYSCTGAGNQTFVFIRQ